MTSFILSNTNYIIYITDAIGNYFTVEYKSDATSITDNKNKTVSFNYNLDGNITKKTDPLKHSINYEHDTNYNVKRVCFVSSIDGKDKESNTYYTYDENGNILTIKDTLNNVTEFSGYNNFNEVGTVKKPITSDNYAVTSYRYDDRGNIISSTDAENRTTTYDYYSNGDRKSVTDCFGNITNYEYDSKGRLIKTKEPLGRITEILEYDGQGNPKKIKDPLGNITEYKYDILGRKVETMYCDLIPEKIEYDLNSNPISTTNRKKISTSVDYDLLDRPIATHTPDGRTSTINYGYGADNNEIVTTIDGEGRTSKQYYDVVGRVIKEEGGGTFATYEYDDIGNMVKAIDAEGRVTKSNYNELNQQISVIKDPAGKNIKSEFTYDILGNKLTSKDGEGNLSSYEYDKLGRLIKVTNIVSGEEVSTKYKYDQREGNLVYNTVINALGRESKTYLDELGRRVKEDNEGDTSDNERRITSYEYDLNGNQKKLIKPNKDEVSYEYDNLNRLKKVNYDNNGRSNTTYEYDINGNRVSMIDVKDGVSITTSYAYDNMDRQNQFTQDGQTINYLYDGSGNKIKVSYACGTDVKNIQYNYDVNNRLNNIEVDGKRVREYSYRPCGSVDYVKNFRKFDTGGTEFTKVQYDYDSAGMPVNISYLDNGNVVKEKYELTFDKRGYVKNEKSYTNYDKEKNVNKTYIYYEIGNLLNVTNVVDFKTTETNYKYDKGN